MDRRRMFVFTPAAFHQASSFVLCQYSYVLHLVFDTFSDFQKCMLRNRLLAGGTTGRLCWRQRKQHIWRYKFNIRTRHTNIFSQHLAHCTDQMIGFYKCFCFNRKKKDWGFDLCLLSALDKVSAFRPPSLQQVLAGKFMFQWKAVVVQEFFFLLNMKST